MQDVAAGAAILLRDGGAEQSDLARFHPEFPVDEPLLGPLGHLRRGLALEELPGHIAQRLQFVGHPLGDVVSLHAVPLPLVTSCELVSTMVVIKLLGSPDWQPRRPAKASRRCEYRYLLSG